MAKEIPVSLLREAATMRRSTLYGWMLANHDTFKEVVEKAVRPNWEALSQTFADQGLTDADKKPPSEECTRQTWWKVRKAVAARRAAAAARESRRPKSDTARQVQPRSEPPLRPLAGSPAAIPNQPQQTPATKEPTDGHPARPSSFTFSATPKESDNNLWRKAKPKQPE